MAFERYKRARARYGEPKVSIWSRGQIGFNNSAIEEYKLDGFQFAVLFYDGESKKVGIMFTNDEKEEGVIKFVKRKSGGYSFSGVGFLKTYNIEMGETKRYPLVWDEENKLHTFQIE